MTPYSSTLPTELPFCWEGGLREHRYGSSHPCREIGEGGGEEGGGEGMGGEEGRRRGRGEGGRGRVGRIKEIALEGQREWEGRRSGRGRVSSGKSA